MKSIAFSTDLFFLVTFLAGCEGVPATTPAVVQPQPSKVAATQETIIPAMPTEAIPAATPTEAHLMLYQDDFSDPGTGWESYRSADGMLDYDNNGYRMKVDTVNNLYWVQANLPHSLADVAVQVQVTKLGGPQPAPYGVLCRLDEHYQYYYFYITSAGEYGIGKMVLEGTKMVNHLLGMDPAGTSEVINRGDQAINDILAICDGQDLSLTVNGQLLEQAQDDEIALGDVGLLAGVRSEPGIDVWFDFIQVMAP
jgi:hypothetical protein